MSCLYDGNTWGTIARCGMASPALHGGNTAMTPSLTASANCPSIDGSMPENEQSATRRSSRVFMRVRVVVAGKNSDNRRFRETCETIVINAHGGLLYLNQPLNMDTMIVLTNPFTQEEQECRIVFLGDATDKGQRVGLEFLTPAPHFWGVDFVPTDWPDPQSPTRQN